MKENSRTKIIPWLMVVMLLFSLAACKESTTPQEGSVLGSVVLENQADHSGVTVQLFVSNVVPEDIRVISNSYQQLEIQPDDELFFDHRYYSPIQTVGTNANGEYSFDDVPYGDYIIALYKDGWGFKYLYNISLDDDAVVVGTKATLSPVYVFPVYITEDLYLSQGKTYLINQNSYLPTGKSIIIEDDANLMISPGVKLTVEGILDIKDLNPMPTFITTSDKIYDSGVPSYGGTIEIMSTAQFSRLSGCKVHRLANGFVLGKSDVEIVNSSFRDCSIGVFLSNVSNYALSSNIVLDCLNNLPAISTQQTNSMSIERNLFWSNYHSVSIDFSNDVLVQNNYFSGGFTQLSSVFQSVVLVKHNIFTNGQRNVSNASKSNMTLEYNDISGETCVYLGSGDYNTLQQGWTRANYNNISAITFAVRADSRYYHPDEFYPLDFTNNYWDTTDVDEINTLIWDYNDYQNPPEQAKWGKIVYTPFRNARVSNAGIQ